MKSPKSVNYTLKVAIILTFILVFIFGNNLLERRHFNELGETLVEFYDDRLVVEGYIFSIAEDLFKIKLLVNHCELESDYTQVINDIEGYESAILTTVESFEGTRLTLEEAAFLADFKAVIQNNLKIGNYELLYKEDEGINREQVLIYNVAIERAITDLEKLSQIQMEEGRNLVKNAEKIVNRSRIWAQFEVASLVILLILIYILVQTSMKINTNWKGIT